MVLCPNRSIFSRAIRVNDQWRITFRIEETRALDVTIEDHH